MIYGITYNGVIRSDNFGNTWTYNKLVEVHQYDYDGDDIEVSKQTLGLFGLEVTFQKV